MLRCIWTFFFIFNWCWPQPISSVLDQYWSKYNGSGLKKMTKNGNKPKSCISLRLQGKVNSSKIFISKRAVSLQKSSMKKKIKNIIYKEYFQLQSNITNQLNTNSKYPWEEEQEKGGTISILVLAEINSILSIGHNRHTSHALVHQWTPLVVKRFQTATSKQQLLPTTTCKGSQHEPTDSQESAGYSHH